MKKLAISKKLLIEIIIAAVLVVAELIWYFLYYPGVSAKDNYVAVIVKTLFLVAAFNVFAVYVMALQIVNRKSEKNNKILEIYLAALIVAMELFVALFCRLRYYRDWDISRDMEMIKLLLVFFHIDILYVITMQIVYSDKFKAQKIIITFIVVLVELFIILGRYAVAIGDPDNGTWELSYLAMNIFSIFASIYILFALGFMIVDSINFRKRPTELGL